MHGDYVVGMGSYVAWEYVKLGSRLKWLFWFQKYFEAEYIDYKFCGIVEKDYLIGLILRDWICECMLHIELMLLLECGDFIADIFICRISL